MWKNDVEDHSRGVNLIKHELQLLLESTSWLYIGHSLPLLQTCLGVT